MLLQTNASVAPAATVAAEPAAPAPSPRRGPGAGHHPSTATQATGCRTRQRPPAISTTAFVSGASRTRRRGPRPMRVRLLPAARPGRLRNPARQPLSRVTPWVLGLMPRTRQPPIPPTPIACATPSVFSSASRVSSRCRQLGTQLCKAVIVALELPTTTLSLCPSVCLSLPLILIAPLCLSTSHRGLIIFRSSPPPAPPPLLPIPSLCTAAPSTPFT